MNTDIAKKLYGDKIIINAELHTKDHSKMNQVWSLHDLYWFKEGLSVDYFVKQSIRIKIKTKKFNCHESNDMKQTKCLDDFYMNKLNCTFPWIKSTDMTRTQCGSDHYIQNLVDLVDDVVKGKQLIIDNSQIYLKDLN